MKKYRLLFKRLIMKTARRDICYDVFEFFYILSHYFLQEDKLLICYFYIRDLLCVHNKHTK
jgi:hypothetical protein